MTPTIFEPVTLGPLTLANRLVVATTTRSRARGNIPTATVAEYYRQRATAGLIVTEETSPMPDGGNVGIPVLFNHDHVSWWGYVTAAVHWRHGNIFVQLAHHASTSSALELSRVRDAFVRSAVLAVKAGFDGVEVNATNGSVVEQSLNPTVSDRTTESHARFMLDVVDDVAGAIGADRTGLRLSPWHLNDGLVHDNELRGTSEYLAAELQRMDLAYLHLTNHSNTTAVSRDALRALRHGSMNTLILGGDFQSIIDIDTAIADGDADLVSVGQPFHTNSDFVERLARGLPLNAPDETTWLAPEPSGLDGGFIKYPSAA